MPNLIKKIFCTPLFNTSSNNDDEVSDKTKRYKTLKLKKFFRAIAITLFVAASLIIISDWSNEDYDNYDGNISDNSDDSANECNVTGISIVGDIVTFLSDDEFLETSSEDIRYYLNEEQDDDDVKAVILEIDSTGGYPVAAEEIAEAIKRFDKPVIAVIREYGNSAAYWIASAADTVFASKNSEVGSIGVSYSYLDYSDQNQKEGIKFIELSSGKFKNSGDPDRSLNQEEKDLIMRDVNIVHQNFVEAVAENRNLDIEKVKEIADGSTMLGEMALEKGLIDKIGLYPDAVDYLEEMLGKEVNVCWY